LATSYIDSIHPTTVNMLPNPACAVTKSLKECKNDNKISDVISMLTENELTDNIENEIKKQGYSDWVLKDFCKVKDNEVIRLLLDRAYMETAKRDYKNRHGIPHGLATAYNSIRLSELVKRDVIESDYINIFGLSKEEVLFTLMTASLIHDSGRFYDDAIKGQAVSHEQHVNDAIAILQKMLQIGEILNKSINITSQEMIKRIKELCLCHDKKLEPSGKVEIALIKLADALDVGPHRVYTKEDKPEELGGDEESTLRVIFKKDKSPIKYFGSLSIESTTFSWNDSEKLLEVAFRIRDFACAEEIKRVLNVLDACAKNGRRPDDAVPVLASKIHIYIEGPKLKLFRLYPSQADVALSRTKATQIPNARIPCVEYRINLLNMNGDAEIELPLQIKNVNNEEGIETQTAILGGLEPSEWENIGMKWFEDRPTGLKKLPPPEYLSSEADGRNHRYRINFGRKLSINETISLIGKCLWKRFMDVMKDEMNHTIGTPTDKLKIGISLPEEANQFKVSAFIEAINVEGKAILKTPIEAKKINGRLLLTAEMTALEPYNSYRLFWQLSK
jgi:metal-dependent HD superfamily phosphatase/phosphodiesterase